MPTTPDHHCLFNVATGQHGYFTTAQARACGFSRSLLSHQARAGNFIRVHRGVYRLRDYPSYYREEVVAAWLAAGRENAVVSHESALDLLELSDIIPNAIHLTVPRSKRHHPTIPGVKFHTSMKPLGRLDVVVRDGIRLTSPARSMLDAAEAGAAPEQIAMAIQQALARGLITPDRFSQEARQRNQRVRALALDAIQLGL